jgi:predicted DNA-binding protein (UPF0278 family)
VKYKNLAFIIILCFFTQSYQSHDFQDEKISKENKCKKITPTEIDSIADSAKINKNFIISLKNCYRNNKILFSRLLEINASYLKYAGKEVKNDRKFLEPFLIRHPEIFQYTAYKIKSDKIFIEKITTSYPGYLQYASAEIKDNKILMTKFIRNNPRNFAYVSDRLKDDFDLTMLAVSNNGSMIKYSSQRLKKNKKIALEAIRSNVSVIEFLSKKIKNDDDIKKIIANNDRKYLENLPVFLKKNYGIVDDSMSYRNGYRITNYKKFFPKQNIIDEVYKIKWFVKEDINSNFYYEIKSIKNNHFGWKNDFFKYEGLYDEVTEFLLNNKIDENTITKLTLTSLWELDGTGNTVAFNLYMLRDLRDKYKNPNFINVVSLTAIAHKKGKNWIITNIQGIFDSDVYMQINFKNGHRKYQIWDLYESNKSDKVKKIIFRVEDDNSEHFKVFTQQPSGHFARVFKGGGYK